MNAPLLATLPAADMNRAKAWYRDKLGLEPVEETAEGGSWYETGGARFLVYPSQFAGTNQATAAGFSVDDFDGAFAEFKSRGVSFEDYDFGDDFKTEDGVLTMPDGAKAAWFKDSEGNTLALTSA
jgi:catechol 2,3-dioxygenase-like lactoylglutathione lyase family enzyme